jgi:membrane protein implicated in regulation of membrane protease activity
MTGTFVMVALMVIWVACVLRWQGKHTDATFALGVVANGFAALVDSWPSWAVNVVTTAILVWAWWRYRRRRDRSPRAYGAKSRALIAALVAKAREATQPRPVLRPVPQGGQ